MPTPNVTQLIRYHYDPLDRLITHALQGEPEQQRFYCKSRLATEIKGAISYSIFQNDEQLLAQQQSETGALETTLLATDQQRSVLNTVKTTHQPQPLAYTPYGHSRVENGMTSLLRFNGERRDPVTGDYLLGNGYRAFKPMLIRFNSPDRLSPFGKGGMNSYAYCFGDPINYCDPNGHFAKFLSNLFKRNTMRWRQPHYKSGPEKTFSTITKTSSGIDMYKTISTPGSQPGYWEEVTRTKYHGDGSYFISKIVKGSPYRVTVNRISQGAEIISYKTNMTLQEHAFSKIPGRDLEQLYDNRALPAMDDAVERSNFNNARSPHSRYPNLSLAARRGNTHVIDQKMLRGEVLGVRPSKAAEFIREDII